MTTGSKLITVGQTETTEAQAEKSPPAKFWLNIGIRMPDGTFISLPVGIAIDSQQERLDKINKEKPATTPKMQLLRKYQQALVTATGQVAQGVPAGTGVPFSEFPNGSKLEFEIRHVAGEKTEETPVVELDLMSPRKVA